MTDDVTADEALDVAEQEAETSQAVASLVEIARELRELAGIIVDISRRPLDQTSPTRH